MVLTPRRRGYRLAFTACCGVFLFVKVFWVVGECFCCLIVFQCAGQVSEENFYDG